MLYYIINLVLLNILFVDVYYAIGIIIITLLYIIK